jgi:hypothetical protein
MLTPSFKNDIRFIFKKIKNREYFSFSKYADGEYKILINKPITNCDGWTFDPTIHNREYMMLLDSFKYVNDEYYVGISCKCCQPNTDVMWMRNNVGTKNVTWANLFVNSNYEYFVNYFLNEFDKWGNDVTLVAHKNGMGKQLPFKITNYIPIDIGYWQYPYLDTIINKCSDIADKKNGQLFLFSSGPLGNILSHQLHSVNPKNTYIDVGSTINPWVVGNNRGYLKGINEKECIW